MSDSEINSYQMSVIRLFLKVRNSQDHGFIFLETKNPASPDMIEVVAVMLVPLKPLHRAIISIKVMQTIAIEIIRALQIVIIQNTPRKD